jgi:hypothetical protein
MPRTIEPKIPPINTVSGQGFIDRYQGDQGKEKDLHQQPQVEFLGFDMMTTSRIVCPLC